MAVRVQREDFDAGAEIARLRAGNPKVGAVASFKLALGVPRLPKTRSGKILRATMRKIADREDFKTPATIDDPAILTEIGAALKAKGHI